MKRAIMACLNRLGLYTRSQVFSILGQPIDPILADVDHMPDSTRNLFADQNRCHTNVAAEIVSELTVEERNGVKRLLEQLKNEDLRKLLLEVSLLGLYLENRPQKDVSREMIRKTLTLCASLDRIPAPKAEHIQEVFHQVLDHCKNSTLEPAPWQTDAFHLLQALLVLLTSKRASLFAELGTYSMDFLLENLSQTVNDLRKEMAFKHSQAQSQIRELYLAEIFEGIEEVSIPIGAVNEETGHANATDLLFVSAIAKYRKARNLFEIGTYMGRTAYHLTHASEAAVVTTVNLPPEADPAWGPYAQIYFRGRERAKQIRQVWANSMTMDTTPYRHQMDFVFVDGDHTYEAVKADTVKALEVLAPGGVLVWHDYAPKSPGVHKFFQEFTRNHPVFRVRKTCLLVHIDGVDPMTYQAHAMLPSKEQKVLKKKLAAKQAA